MSTLGALLFALVLTACAPSPMIAPPASTTPTTTPPATTPPVTTPFAPTGPWTTAVPRDVHVVADGGALGREIATEVLQYYGHASINTTSYAPTVVQVGAGQPTVPVGYWNCQGKATIPTDLLAQFAAVPLPPDTPIPTDSDAHVVIWQPSSDAVWELWKTQRDSDGQWSACWGGRLDHASTSIGTFPFPYGGTASGISALAGLVTPADLARGRIDHALSAGVVHTLAGTTSWPANRNDGRSTGTAIAEGQRLRLDPSVDVDALPLTPLGRMIAHALQDYGMIVRDTSGSVTIYAQNSNTVTSAGLPDPYQPFFGGKPKWAQLDGIPWDRLQTLALDYGRG